MVKWIVQWNLGSMVETADNVKMKNICEKHGFDFEGVKVIPFSGMVPDHDPSVPTIFYGGTGWINNIYTKYPDHRGIFFNPESVFTFWINKYKHDALNYGAIETNFDKLSKEDYPDDKMFFIRPVSDQKEFSGSVMKFADIKLWSDKIFTDVPDFGSTPIVVGEPYGLGYEWRLFILNGKVVTGSQYRTYYVTNVKPSLPQEVIDFAEKQAKVYSPSSLFVMDVGKNGDDLYVIEIGCFNSAGFYASDLETLMCEVSKHVEELYEL